MENKENHANQRDRNLLELAEGLQPSIEGLREGGVRGGGEKERDGCGFADEHAQHLSQNGGFDCQDAGEWSVGHVQADGEEG